jgi:hypothetical protein
LKLGRILRVSIEYGQAIHGVLLVVWLWRREARGDMDGVAAVRS